MSEHVASWRDLDERLTARIEPFDSFWEAPEDLESGYRSFGRFYRHNYLDHLPADRRARILVVSCGPGYFVQMLEEEGYESVIGIDSMDEKCELGRHRGLDCRRARVFRFLGEQAETADRAFDAIVCEQEINHLTKPEILSLLAACRATLKAGGTLIVHSINGANPMTGSESRAGNFDHYNSFTEYSLRQVLVQAGFSEVRVFPLRLYVFWRNPLNYLALAAFGLSAVLFRAYFRLVGKDARIMTKKIAACGRCPVSE